MEVSLITKPRCSRQLAVSTLFGLCVALILNYNLLFRLTPWLLLPSLPGIFGAAVTVGGTGSVTTAAPQTLAAGSQGGRDQQHARENAHHPVHVRLLSKIPEPAQSWPGPFTIRPRPPFVSTA